MRLRMALALALLLIPSLSWGGAAAKLRGVMSACSAQTGTVNTLNGYGSVDVDLALYDTGVATPSAKPICSGTASINASCNGYGDTSSVSLKINGATVQSISCGAGVSHLGVVLSWPVSGVYTAQVVLTATGEGAAYADSFSFPIAQ